MSYSHYTNIPSDNHRPPVVFVPPFLQAPNWHPGDATYSAQSSGHSYYDPLQQIDLYNQPTPRRRSSASHYPYPASSPTRTRFAVAPPPRTQNVASTLGPERRSRVYVRGEEAYGLSARHDPHVHSSWGASPSNLELVPQHRFMEPASSIGHTYRYEPIMFQLDGFPEVGVKVGTLMNGEVPRLQGEMDYIFEEVPEREIKVQLNWPGYASCSVIKHVKTAKLQRATLATILADTVVKFACKVGNLPVERGKERWMLETKTGIKVKDVFIARLVHCGGSHWQMDLWAPRVKY